MPTELKANLPEALRGARMTAAQLARKCGVTDSAVSQWVSGAVRPAGPSRLLIARALKTPLPVVESWFSERAAA